MFADWTNILCYGYSADPPYIPEVSDAADTSNFDDIDEAPPEVSACQESETGFHSSQVPSSIQHF